MKQKIWKPREEAADIQKLQTVIDTLGVHPIIARMLAARGLTEVEEIRHFFEDDLNDRFDPSLMKDLDKAVARIAQAIERQEKIVIYGDYDVDGITSTSVLKRCLENLGGQPVYYIPDRMEEGYGLNRDALASLVADGFDLAITVDCGISSADLVGEFHDQIDIIVTDHHNPGTVLPPAYAVLNPKQEGCTYPDKNLAGVGVAYTLCRGLWRHFRGEDYDRDVELVALGTVADVVPLLAENRIYVKAGLARCRHTQNAGLLALLDVCGVKADAVTAERIGFSLAPRLNAAGRLAHARLGVELLTATDRNLAQTQAEELFDINAHRQGLEKKIYSAAEERIAELGNAKAGMLVVDGHDWHSGVIGIVASRLTEKYHRPVVMISIVDGVGKGSCRSIHAMDMYAALNSCADILLQFGGHHQAAGFSVREDLIPTLRQRLEAYAAAHLREEDFVPILEIERMLEPADINLRFMDELDKMEPFGEDNPAPIFASADLTLKKVYRIGADHNHLKGMVEKGDAELEIIGWGMGDLLGELFEEDRVAVAYALKINEWQDMRRIQAVIRDIHVEADEAIVLTRDALVPVYKDIRSLLRSGAKAPWELELLLDREGVTYSRKMLYTALKVFHELELIELIAGEKGPVYRLGHVDGKMDLSMSLTYLHLSGGEG